MLPLHVLYALLKSLVEDGRQPESLALLAGSWVPRADGSEAGGGAS